MTESVFSFDELPYWATEFWRSVRGESGSDGGWLVDSQGISFSYSPPSSDEGGLSELDSERWPSDSWYPSEIGDWGRGALIASTSGERGVGPRV